MKLIGNMMKKLKNEYIKVSNVLDNQTCNLLFEYVKRLYQQYEKFKTFIFKADLERELREITLLKDDCGYCKGDDMLSDTLLLVLQPIIEKEIGLKLIPTYSFMRLYTKGNSLAKHTDRESCEISTTIFLGGIPYLQLERNKNIIFGCSRKSPCAAGDFFSKYNVEKSMVFGGKLLANFLIY